MTSSQSTSHSAPGLAATPEAIKKRVLEPITCDVPSDLLPELDPSLLP